MYSDNSDICQTMLAGHRYCHKYIDIYIDFNCIPISKSASGINERSILIIKHLII